MARRKTLANAIKRRNARRLWNHLVAKLSSKPIDDLPLEEDAWDRHERHMKPIREAQKHNDY
tara:strand:- start:5338 stop:5523 length:186 start_codon:yes stop_codon:yes gene_type:complete